MKDTDTLFKDNTVLQYLLIEQNRTNEILTQILEEIRKNNSMRIPVPSQWQTYGTGPYTIGEIQG